MNKLVSIVLLIMCSVSYSCSASRSTASVQQERDVWTTSASGELACGPESRKRSPEVRWTMWVAPADKSAVLC